eukprot:6964367-Lingulodinium_polyedra.AAC.1
MQACPTPRPIEPSGKPNRPNQTGRVMADSCSVPGQFVANSWPIHKQFMAKTWPIHVHFMAKS